MRHVVTVLAGLWLTLVCYPTAYAQDTATLSQRRFGGGWVGQELSVDVSVADFLNRDVQHKLRSGLPQTLVMQTVVYTDKSKKPLVAYAQTCRVVFDIWDEIYRVERLTPRQQNTFLLHTPAEISKVCLELQKVRLGNAGIFQDRVGDSVYVGLLVELNPLSEKTVERIRRWLVRPGGSKGLADDSFYGSFVSLFVNPRIGTADRTLRIRSQTMQVPGRKGVKRP